MSSPRSSAELTAILHQALEALESGRRGHIWRRSRDQPSGPVAWHLARDLEKLNSCCPDYTIADEDDYWGIITDCLETALINPLQSYKRPKDPISKHREALGLEMFALVVQLDDFTRPIYTKFCLKEQSDGTYYISIDCHP